jgi:ligand-binding sensor domain-containing protein
LWWAVGAFVLFIAAIYFSAAIKLAVGRIGWSNIATNNSSLPGDMINDLLPLGDGRMLIATDNGAAIWTAPATTDASPAWTVYHSDNSGLLDDNVVALAKDDAGDLWFATGTGISRYNGATWTSYPSEKMGVTSNTITSLVTAPDGTVYAGTLSGAVMFDGAGWGPVTALTGKPVFSLAFHGDSLWAGTDEGAGRLEVRTGAWTVYPTNAPVKHILFDSSGTLWVATSGAGLARWDGSTWQYFTTSSGIPYNTVNWVTEIQPGLYWVATALPTEAGGFPASFDGEKWHKFETNNSGVSGSEPLVIAFDDGTVWVGTRTRGIETYKLGR